MIPSFSVPGTSIGLEEIESFIFKRAGGASRMDAGILFQLQGFCEDYLRSLERRVLAGIHRAKALFLARGDHGLPPWQWLIDAAGESAHPVYQLNRLSIAAGWGAVFCALAPGAGGRATKAGTGHSHDFASAQMPMQPIDSG